MPVGSVRANTSDATDPTFEITNSEKAFHKNDAESPQYKFYRNVVNRERKACKANFYKSKKVEHMKEENLKAWWKEVKRLCGAQSFSGNVTSQIQLEGVENIKAKELANLINKAFLEPLSYITVKFRK